METSTGDGHEQRKGREEQCWGRIESGKAVTWGVGSVSGGKREGDTASKMMLRGEWDRQGKAVFARSRI